MSKEVFIIGGARTPMTEYVGALNLHSFYVRYRLPLMVETQHFEYLF